MMNPSKILVVNCPSSFASAKALLLHQKNIGVDIEGDLEKGGIIELIQCATDDKIIIFDIYGIRSQAAN